MRFCLTVGLVGLTGCSAPLDAIVLRPAFDAPYSPEEFGVMVERVNLPLEEGQVRLWHFATPNSKALIVVAPGSDANKSRYAEYAPIFIERGYELVLMDYRGFGEGVDDGPPTLVKASQDVVAALEYATRRHEHVYGYGVSLGAALLAHAATQVEVDGVILEATLVLDDLVPLWLDQRNLDFVPFVAIGDLFVDVQSPAALDVARWVPRIEAPKLFLHGPADDVTPIEGAREVYAAAAGRKEFVEVPGGHGRFIQEDADAWMDLVDQWVEGEITGVRGLRPGSPADVGRAER